MYERELPVLVDKSSTGKEKMYQATVEAYEDGTAGIVTRWGYTDGKIQEKTKKISKGKNIGKKNETTAFQQAYKEAQSAYNRKKDAGYVAAGDTESSTGTFDIRPMLAHPYENRKRHLKWPAILQPKLDGMRVLAVKDAEGEIHFLSRNGKPISTLDHLKEDLNIYMMKDEIFDGEIYIHGLPFQEIISYAKKAQEGSEKLEFWVFDMLTPGQNCAARLLSLAQRGLPFSNDESAGGVKLVESLTVEDEDQVLANHSKFVQQGFEGVIVRNTEGLYKPKYRSNDLLKYKEFIDEEFEIIGHFEDVDGGVVWQCKTVDGSEFGVRPKGTQEIRKEWAETAKDYIGKALTVRYQNLSPEGIPIFPVGIAVRDYE